MNTITFDVLISTVGKEIFGPEEWSEVDKKSSSISREWFDRYHSFYGADAAARAGRSASKSYLSRTLRERGFNPAEILSWPEYEGEEKCLPCEKRNERRLPGRRETLPMLKGRGGKVYCFCGHCFTPK